jgi:hypothetical protein
MGETMVTWGEIGSGFAWLFRQLGAVMLIAHFHLVHA